MNHDYAHCLEYKNGKCQKKKCFRAQMVEDLKNYTGDISMITWARLRGTKYCEIEWEINRMSDDTISRQAAIDEVAKHYRAFDNDMLELITFEIKCLPCVEQRGQWIPVTERLPDINDHYTSDVCLVYCDNGAYTFAELEENIFGQVSWTCEREDDYHEAVGTVIAWMPLPEPYKEGEQNG